MTLPISPPHTPSLICLLPCFLALQAVQRLDALASSAAAAGSEAGAVAGAALLRRLQDDSPAVVLAVLDAASLLVLPPAAVFDGLAGCFTRALQQVGWHMGRADVVLARAGQWQCAIKSLLMPHPQAFHGCKSQQVPPQFIIASRQSTTIQPGSTAAWRLA